MDTQYSIANDWKHKERLFDDIRGRHFRWPAVYGIQSGMKRPSSMATSIILFSRLLRYHVFNFLPEWNLLICLMDSISIDLTALKIFMTPIVYKTGARSVWACFHTCCPHSLNRNQTSTRLSFCVLKKKWIKICRYKPLEITFLP